MRQQAAFSNMGTRATQSRWYRPVMLGLALAFVGLLAFELALVLPRMRPEAVGVDFHQYLVHTERWLAGGSLYLDRQLQGPYEIVAGDSLYPPPILYLTVPFALGVPEVLWWIIPLSIIVWVIATYRPAPWAWPVMAAMLATPRSIEIVMYGNPVMWSTAALAAGTILAWPSVFVILKPSLAPLALWGIRHRSWWITLGVAGLMAIPFGTAWFEWVQVLLDSSGSFLYSLPDLMFVLLPVVAWAARRAQPEDGPEVAGRPTEHPEAGPEPSILRLP